jgi:hypothetical protein
MIGDAINNFRTVQSFGYEELIIKKYQSFLDVGFKKSTVKNIKGGIAYGFSNLILYLILALLFYLGGVLIEANCEDKEILY